GVNGLQVDGNDVLAVDLAASNLIKEIRDGKGPRFLHAITYRFKGHVSVDPATYRDGDEVVRALEDDPMLGMKIPKEEVEKVRIEVQAEVKKALEAASAAP